MALILTLAISSFAADTTWVKVWSDEFDGPAGAPPSPDKWTHDLGGGGWGNGELERYTGDPANASLDGSGHLIITALRKPSGEYTSARLKTQGLFQFKYGKMEAAIRIPYGQGIWPAFWALGADIGQTGWPRCGEIDVMENVGREPAILHGTLHGPGYSGDTALTNTFELPEGQRLADSYHVYAVEWTERAIRFLLDGQTYYTVTPDMLPAGTKWVYRHPFFLLLNLAVGGRWPGSPDATTTLPQRMLIDYVRVYQSGKGRAGAGKP